MNEQEIEARAQRAVELFHEGFNCAQAVFASCADIYGVQDEHALYFVLIVHTVQTILVVLLGVYAWLALNFSKVKL